jgi:hypothetical protein
MFTSSDLECLKRFCEVCDCIAACRFITDLPKQSHHIMVGTGLDGRVYDEYPRYDDDDFRAFLTHYRKLRAQQEPTNLLKIIKLLNRKGDPSDRTRFDQLKKELAAEGRGWWMARLKDKNGNARPVTQQELEDLIINGDVFHSDPQKRAALLKLLGDCSLPKAIAFFNYLRFVRAVIYVAQEAAKTVRWKGYLNEVAAQP